MAYDPNFPPTNAELISADFRTQFQGLKALIDAVQAQVNGLLPVGSIVGWAKSRANIPALPGTWVECNGQVLNDPLSPFHGQTMDDINGAGGPQRFLRGAAASGGTGGADTHTHDDSWADFDGPNKVLVDTGSADYAVKSIAGPDTDAASSLPSYYEVVWVMRVR